MELDLSPLALPGVDSTRPIVIAGPCSAETEEQVLTTARQLFKNGIKIFRAGIWKPRTKPGGFEGVGEVGLPWLAHVKEELGMLTSTEVATPAHVEAALQHGIDLLWIGARTVVNPFAMQELADALRGVDIPVLVKNPVNPDLELWIGGLQRLNDAGRAPTRCHSSWLLELRQAHLPQSSALAHSHRAAPTHSQPSDFR